VFVPCEELLYFDESRWCNDHVASVNAIEVRPIGLVSIFIPVNQKPTALCLRVSPGLSVFHKTGLGMDIQILLFPCLELSSF